MMGIMDERIKVSISCLTYNHEKYIRRCLEGFVKQKGPKTVSLTDASDESNVTMTVQLDYDFYIGRTEVTREQYAALMGGDIPENEKKLPQVNVNFYDAVLYANAHRIYLHKFQFHSHRKLRFP